MKSKPTRLAAGIVLAGVLAGSGQSVVQFATNSSSVPDWATSTAVPDYASPMRLAVQRTNDINTAVSVDYATVTNLIGTVEFTDPDAALSTQRFYRVASHP